MSGVASTHVFSWTKNTLAAREDSPPSRHAGSSKPEPFSGRPRGQCLHPPVGLETLIRRSCPSRKGKMAQSGQPSPHPRRKSGEKRQVSRAFGWKLYLRLQQVKPDIDALAVKSTIYCAYASLTPHIMSQNGNSEMRPKLGCVVSVRLPQVLSFCPFRRTNSADWAKLVTRSCRGRRKSPESFEANWALSPHSTLSRPAPASKGVNFRPDFA